MTRWFSQDAGERKARVSHLDYIHQCVLCSWFPLSRYLNAEQDLWPRSTIFHNVYQQEGKPLFRHFTDHQLLQPILNLRPDYEVFSLELEQVMHPNKSDGKGKVIEAKGCLPVYWRSIFHHLLSADKS